MRDIILKKHRIKYSGRLTYEINEYGKERKNSCNHLYDIIHHFNTRCGASFSSYKKYMVL